MCKRQREQIGAGEGVSRRAFLIASAGLLLPKSAWTQSLWNSTLCWTLDDTGDTAKEVSSGSNDPIASRTGHAVWVGTGRDRALRMDGYSVWINHRDAHFPIAGSNVTVSAWLAIESYPVNEAAIVDLKVESDIELSFTIDRWGYLKASVRNDALSTSCKSAQAIPKAKWHHLAVVFGTSRTTIFLDGHPCGNDVTRPTPNLARASDITIGKTPNCPVVAGVFPTGVLNGLLRDVRVFDGQLSPGNLVQLINESRPNSEPDLQINGPWCIEDPQRPIYHALPPRAWTNEPHGLIHWGGKYHLFYQKNPNGPYWGHINWGHMISADLYQWIEMPVALSPEPGPDSEGCWSGSVINFNGKLAILYTGGDGKRASICLALSDDGIHFHKHPGNPVIPHPPQIYGVSEFRDPFVWREGETFYLIIGSAVAGKGGTALLYRSNDMVHWEFRKPLLVGDRESSGVFWEMPVFIKLGEEHALIVCEVPGRASYWVGTWKDETFTPRSVCPQRLELFNHLLSPTPHVLEDGRVITMGIIPEERSPKECWRAGWAHHYSIPRLISADASGFLRQKAFEGIERWTEPIASHFDVVLADGAMMQISQASGACLHIHAVFHRGQSQSITLRVRCSPHGQEYTDIHYRWEIGRLILDRTHSSLDPEVKRDSAEATYFPRIDNVLAVDVYLDNSVLEVFVDQRSAFAARIYPTLETSTGILVGSKGMGGTMETITIARMKPTR